MLGEPIWSYCFLDIDSADQGTTVSNYNLDSMQTRDK